MDFEEKIFAEVVHSHWSIAHHVKSEINAERSVDPTGDINT
jgi:hypothetical protein